MKPPILWLRMDNLTSTVGSVTLTNVNSVTFTAGKYGNSAYFSSSNQALTATYTIPDVFTLEFWVYQTTAGRFLSNKWTGVPNIYYIRTAGSTLTIYIGNNAGAYAYFTPSWGTSTWNHLGITRGTDGYVHCYKDNVEQGTAQYIASPVSFASAMSFGDSEGHYEGFAGYIDNFKVYDYEKNDFSDRFNERGGLNDIVSLIYNTYSGGECTVCDGICDPTCEGVCDGMCNPSCQTCDGTCDPICEGVCDGMCNPMCQGVCDGTCNPSCQTCDPVCQSVCDSSCNPVCQGVCDGTCNPSCEYCDPLCTASCDGYCNMDGGGEG